MAAYGAMLREKKTLKQAQAYLSQLFQHNVSQDTSGRNALNTFLSGKGDVLLDYESDAKLAQSQGKNPDKWEDVRTFLPLLSQERWYTQTKRGYARGWEPVRYVENVQAYLNILQVAGLSPNTPVAPPDPEIDP